MAILALVCSSILVVISRCTTSAANSALRMHAFEVARENMEKLLASDSVKEMTEYDSSDKYPEIQWQTTVETFYEPITSRMWIQAVCSAEYTDMDGQEQTVELTHWLTDLSKQQLLEIMAEKEKQEQQLAERNIATIEEAAAYAGVDVETIQQWEDNGMIKTDDGYYIKDWLDLFKESDGNPSLEQVKQQVEADERLEEAADQPEDKTEDKPKAKKPRVVEDEDGVKRIGGRTLEEWIETGFPRELLEELFNEY